MSENRDDIVAITVDLSAGDCAGLDAWIAAQPEPRPLRPEAARRILAEALRRDAKVRTQTPDEAAVPELPDEAATSYDGAPM